MEKYIPSDIEKKWQKYWEDNGTYKNYSREKKFYALDMFPYPSGVGLHVGHPKGYIATDVVSRFKMLNGYSVLHPMGWDAFGLPAENYAIKNKTNPNIFTAKSIANYKKQLEMFGFTYDWDREINTTDPQYYKWTQWIFLKLFEKGLAYESNAPINWCPSCKTGLSNEDLEDGKCERCGSEVEQKPMRQWVLKMTDYADRLLYDLDSSELDWEDMIVDQQKNWIGRSEGVQFEMKIKDSDEKIEVYTTRIDTAFGITYAVVAPEHPIIEKLKDKISNYAEVAQYVADANKKTNLERTELQKEKTGKKLEGINVINPFTNEAVPLFVADYVIGGYGTGAVMAVPAHDERDFEFANKKELQIKYTIIPEYGRNRKPLLGKPDGQTYEGIEMLKAQILNDTNDECIRSILASQIISKRAYTVDGILINSGSYSILTSKQAREKMADWLEKEKIGKRKVNYKMRDWVYSRQRYWGEPIPIVHCEKCGAVAVPEQQLPVMLPDVENYEPTGTGESPLAAITDWVNTICPKCGGPGKRETNTMPQWGGSSWYYLRYIDPKNDKELVNKELEKEWMPVDLYVGGAEHATRHLLYARFWHKFLYDIGVVSTIEPFKKLLHVGLIMAEDGRKMSKRWNNVVNPDEIIGEFGADAMRLYEMFMGPFTQSIAWSTSGVSGVRRFLDKVWNLQEKTTIDNIASDKKITSLLHKTIKKVTEDIENFRFNTAISAMMILVNAMEKEPSISVSHYETLLTLLSSFAPHITEELWEKIGHKESIFLQDWPKVDEKYLQDEEIEMVVQVNGKVRERLMVANDVTEDEAKETALESDKVKVFTDGKEIKKIIFVPGKLINIVVI
ncbi:MAG: Leucine-tRNA ligase [Candidatus Moranbacteria bacterium GW2011_GWC2_37_73]|nr:MAG: Leucine-tRNA ligase [Parcubacteria group bacterium GW2011_GWC1_36_108]KKQ01187.1 MAG: Leucine-tRNA ligase [Candidatus Moranbacteria bacterium GW2011_GWD1_36_198]KKQ02388.1 MAG: Leucine-tRNA ligase [Candidatus Moranbacteria bacterium GW2011_GWD2_36_198]KKQ40079.1 MAG: Leucine-tRNA ligase [Candidatus Moranbacteria bacterium GW2011_GWC2_37_73]HAR99549.1 leucine--tRNA ligase [Candidatus Moranbacteria bacterium]